MRSFKSYSFHLVSLSLILMLSGCSNQKDGFLNRAYHNTTARYNGYYYSRESIKEGVAIVLAEHKDDFEEILPIFIIPTSEEEAGKVTSQMDRAITKSTAVIKRHSMKISDKERCRWIDENYMAVGKANFYKRIFPEAERIFEFVAKEFKTLPAKYDGQLWLTRTYIEQNKLEEAGLLMSVVAQDKELPAKKRGEFHKVYAHYYIARQNYVLAAENLMKALPYEKKKKAKNRLTYILAQLYQRAGKSNDAIKNFELVAQNSNDYEMVFNARILQATNVQNKVSGYRVKDDLMKMLRDDKNIEYQDQIYYALGEISSKERKYSEALDYWQKSAAVSTVNVRQKSRSFLRVAQYYFDQKLYQSSQVFYDSAVAVLPANFPEAEQIKKTATDLTELVKELNTIYEQDSLLALARLSPEDLDKRLNQLTKQLQKKADDEAAAKESAIINPIALKPPPGSNSSAAVGDFYFYNVAAKGMGVTDFKKKWGTRPLEDNWRRKNKVVSDGGSGGFAQDPSLQDESNASGPVSAVTIKKSDLKKNIPISVAQNIEANNKIIEALYSSGNIYKEKFKDNENAIEAFANLVQRYDTSRYEVIAYYQLYRLYLQKETKKEGAFFSLDTKSSSAYYKGLILTEYPNSEFARLVENPEFLKENQTASKTDLVDYAKVYQLYKLAAYTDALLACDSLINGRPSSPIASKFYFLKSRVQAELHDVDGMIAVLTTITLKFPNTAEATEAQRILDVLRKKMPAPTADTTTPISIPVADTLALKPPVSDYKVDVAAEHYLAVILPNNGQDINMVKASLINFNAASYGAKKLDITNTFLDNNNLIVIVKSFTNKDEAMVYYKSFTSDKKFLKSLNSKPENKTFIITVENFISLFKLKKTEDYLNFFALSYLK